MSKNLTRKSAALGAVVALATTLFAGAPAQAAGETISLAPSAGTSYKTLLGSTFELTSLFSGWGTAPSALTYQVTGTGVAAADVTASVSAGVERETSTNWTSKSPVDKTSPATISIPGSTVTLGKNAQLKIKLNPTNITTTTTIAVTAFNDSYLTDGKLDASGNEVKSETVNITFVKPSEVTATTTLDAPKVGQAANASGDKLTAHVTLGDINLPLLDSALVKVIFKRNGVAGTNGSTTGSATSYVKANAALDAEAAISDTIAAADVFTAQAVLSTTSGGTFSNSGTAAISGVTAGAKTLVLDADATATSDKSTNILPNSGNYTVRSGTSKVTVYAVAKWTDDDGVLAQPAGAGVTAKITVSETGNSSLAATSTVSAGGKSLTDATSTAADSISFTATTDADGQVSFDITATGKKTDAIKVKVEFLSAGAWSSFGGSSGFVTYTWADAARANDKFVRVNAVGGADSESTPLQTIGVKKGGDYTVTYNLVDEFGGLVTDTTNVRAVHLTASATGVAIDKTVAFANGVATATLTDSSSAAQNYVLNADLQYKNSSDVWTDSVATTATTGAANVTADARVYAQSSVTPGFLTVVKDVAKPTRATDAEAFVKSFVDTYANGNTDAVVATGDEVIHGVVTSDDGSSTVGVPVTISGAGLQFVAVGAGATADAAIALGSITVYTNAAGAYSVKVKSHLAGKVVVTVVAGSITKTTTPEWVAAAATAGKTIAITAPANVSAGTSNTIVVKLTDKFGNAVQTTTSGVERLSVSVSGAGITGTVPATTDANGELRFYQLLGAADSGSFVVTVKYDRDGASTTYAQITKTATVTIGAAPAAATSATAAVAGSTGKFFVSATAAAGKSVVVKVAGKFVVSFKATGSKKTVAVKSTKGSKKVTVYVGGKLTATKTVTVK